MSITLSIIKKFLESTVYLYKTMEKQIIARFWTASQLVWNREVALWFLASLKVDHNMEPSLLLYTNYKISYLFVALSFYKSRSILY